MASDWHYIDLDTKALVEQRTEQGVTTRSSPSPFDIPEALRVEYKVPSQRLRVEFKYIGEEPVADRPSEGHVTFGIGKNSGRIYSIELPFGRNSIAEAAADSLAEQIVSLLAELTSISGETRRTKNYVMAGQAVRSAKKELVLSAITAA